ncbi:MAG TPA: TIGR03435 family protein [Terracidiphilus sp.]|jgi:uncharacterized protein (TIGR03435 family)
MVLSAVVVFGAAVFWLGLHGDGQSTAAQTTAEGAGASVSGATGALSFDVASIHPNKDDRSGRSHIVTNANSALRTENTTVMQIVQWAYELPDSRILNAPGWVMSDKYDIEAKADPAVGMKLAAMQYKDARPKLDEMVKALLAERFHLVAHLEKREMPVYFLAVAKGGAKLAPVQDGPKHVDTSTRGNGTKISITSSSHATADLAEVLGRIVGRVVVDETGLQGNYTIEMHFARYDAGAAMPDDSSSAEAGDPEPSVFTALKEQPGLELKPGKAPVDVLVIDRVEAPTEN